MRMYVEANLRFSEQFKVDPEEAIDNLDRTFEMKLESFHTLYDVTKRIFPYFEHADTTLLIAIRNAIHHRNHPLFRSLNHRLHLEDGVEKSLGASFLLAEHITTHGGQILMSHFVKLDDLDARIDPSLSSPHLDKSVNSEKALMRFKTVNEQLHLKVIRERASQDRYSKDRVYLDLMPIFTSAVSKVFRAMKTEGIGFIGFDAETYLTPFTSEIVVDLNTLNFRRLWLRGYGPIDLIPVPID